MSYSGDGNFRLKPLSRIDIGDTKVHFSAFKWDIENYKFRTCKADEQIESPHFWCFYDKWKLSLFPNGERCKGTVGKVLMSLTKVSDNRENIYDLTVSFEIILQREGKDDFFKGNVDVEDEMDMNDSFKFPFSLSRSDMLRKDSGYFDDDFLHISGHLFLYDDDGGMEPMVPVSSADENSTDKKDVGANTSPEDFDESSPDKNDAGTNTSSEDIGNLLFQEDRPITEKEDSFSLLSKDLEELHNSRRFADVILKLGKHEFPAHKGILGSRSKVFEAMFEHDMQENRRDTVDLVDMEAGTVQHMLRYMYCGKVGQQPPEEALNLYVAADRYDLQELVLHCRTFIVNGISVDNIGKISVVADLHNDQLLMDSVKLFLSENLKEVLKTDTWMTFAEDNPILSSKLIRFAVLNEY